MVERKCKRHRIRVDEGKLKLMKPQFQISAAWSALNEYTKGLSLWHAHRIETHTRPDRIFSFEEPSGFVLKKNEMATGNKIRMTLSRYSGCRE